MALYSLIVLMCL